VSHGLHSAFGSGLVLFLVVACGSSDGSDPARTELRIAQLDLLARGSIDGGHITLDATTSLVAVCSNQGVKNAPLSGVVEVSEAPCDGGAPCSLRINRVELHVTNVQVGSTTFDEIVLKNDNPVTVDVGFAVKNAFSVLDDLVITATASSKGRSTTSRFLQTSPLDGLYDTQRGTFTLEGTYIPEGASLDPGCK
jgi:hypothetical protein